MPDEMREQVARRVEAILDDPESEERRKLTWTALLIGERIDEAFVEKLLGEDDDGHRATA